MSLLNSAGTKGHRHLQGGDSMSCAGGKGEGESSASGRASANPERDKTCCFLKNGFSVAMLNSNALPSSRLFLMVVEYHCACRAGEG